MRSIDLMEMMVRDYIYTEDPNDNKYYVDINSDHVCYSLLFKYIRYMYDCLDEKSKQDFVDWALKQYNGCMETAFSNHFTARAYREACSLWRKLFSALYINYSVSPSTLNN